MNSKGKKVAFALGGLGGNNAHGAGFLAAARELDITPDIISCTSGQIIWAYNYLSTEGPLKDAFRKKLAEDAPIPGASRWTNWSLAISQGVEGVFRPARPEYFQRWIPTWNPFDRQEWLDRLFPAKWFESKRSDSDCQEIADCFNDSAIAIAFNVYHPNKGISYLHLNDAGVRFLDKDYDCANAANNIHYRPITGKSVRDALWLYLYGFENGRELVDGAYHRQIIISELHNANTIFAVKPQAQRWSGRMPQNYFEIQDFEVEMWFNSSYASQVAALEQINKLVKDDCFKGGPCAERYHWIELVPVEVQGQQGFADYFVESSKVFDSSFTCSLEKLKPHA